MASPNDGFSAKVDQSTPSRLDSRRLLARIESRHEDLLTRIDELNEQIAAALEEATKSNIGSDRAGSLA